jgi:hypothetical protein
MHITFLLLAIALGFSSVASADLLPQRVLIVLTNTATGPGASALARAAALNFCKGERP